MLWAWGHIDPKHRQRVKDAYSLERIPGSANRGVDVSLLALLDLGNDLFVGRIQRREHFSSNTFVPFVVDEDLLIIRTV